MENVKSIQKILGEQNLRYREILQAKITVPANSETMTEIKISTLGAFMCKKISGSFETLQLVAGDITDTGVCSTSLFLQDGATALPLTNDFVDTELFLSPGRVKSPKALNNLTSANPSSFLFEPIDFSYTFAMNSSIQIKLKNTSDTPNEISLAFHGYRLRA